MGLASAYELIERFLGPLSEPGASRDPKREMASAADAGLVVTGLRAARCRMEFYDVGAIVWILRKVEKYAGVGPISSRANDRLLRWSAAARGWRSERISARRRQAATSGSWRRTPDGAGGLDLQPFFDLITLHELGHAFEVLGDLRLPTFWLGEIFANLALHAFVATKRPESLPILEVLSTVGAGSRRLAARKRAEGYSTLEDLEAHYTAASTQ